MARLIVAGAPNEEPMALWACERGSSCSQMSQLSAARGQQAARPLWRPTRAAHLDGRPAPANKRGLAAAELAQACHRAPPLVLASQRQIWPPLQQAARSAHPAAGCFWLTRWRRRRKLSQPVDQHPRGLAGARALAI